MSTSPKSFFTVEEYLALDRGAETKHQYIDGEIFDMSGGSVRHALIPMRLSRAIGNRLPPGCEVFSSDLRVCVDRKRLITYPDLTVICGQLQYLEGTSDTVLNPKLVVEVLSPTTEAYDRGKKSYLYRQVSSLEEYLLVSQESQQIEVYRRIPDARWESLHYIDPDAIIDLVSLGIQIPMSEIYAGVDNIQPPREHSIDRSD